MTDQTAVAELPGLGHNQPPLGKLIAGEQGDFAAVVTAYLEDEYSKQPGIVSALLDEARQIPKVIDDEDTKSKVKSIIKRMRDQVKLLAAAHEKEKQPYLRGGQAVDQYLFGLIDKLARRSKTNRPGAADILNERLTDYDLRILAAELARRKAEADRLEREANEKREREEKAQREATEALEAAERARNPERIEQKREVAEQKAEQATVASAEAAHASAKAEQAMVDTYAKPADIMRSRGDDGTLSTMATEPYVILDDRSQLDFIKLAPFFTQAEVEKALRGWAKNNGYSVQMNGARIGKKPKSVVR